MHFERLPQVADIDEIDKDKKLLAPKCRKKMTGGRRSSPAGEGNPPPDPCGRGHGMSDKPTKVAKIYAI